MPYLPPADPEPNELACAILFYPNRAEYRQALFGAYATLSNVWEWEASRATQELIRQQWLIAELETLRCWDMTCFDDLIAAIQSLEQTVKDTSCCGPNEGTEVSPDGPIIYPTEGPAPLPDVETDFDTDPFPVTPASDPDDDGIVTETDWDNYVCGAADLLVDTLIDWLLFTNFALTLGYGAVQVLDELVKIIAARALPGLFDDLAIWTLPSYTEVITEFYDDLTSQILTDGAADLDALRDDLKCAVVGQPTVDLFVSAFQAVLGANLQNAVLISYLTSGPIFFIASLIWNAAFNADFEECECVPDPGDLTTLNGVRFHAIKTSADTSSPLRIRATNMISGSGADVNLGNGNIDATFQMAQSTTINNLNPGADSDIVRDPCSGNVLEFEWFDTSSDGTIILDFLQVYRADEAAWKSVGSVEVLLVEDGNYTIDGNEITFNALEAPSGNPTIVVRIYAL